MDYHDECASNGYQYDLTSDMTTCQYGSDYDWIAYNGVGSQSGPEENGGIFSAGTYYYTIYDTAGDSLDGNAAFHFETRAVGSTGAWMTISAKLAHLLDHLAYQGQLLFQVVKN